MEENLRGEAQITTTDNNTVQNAMRDVMSLMDEEGRISGDAGNDVIFSKPTYLAESPSKVANSSNELSETVQSIPDECGYENDGPALATTIIELQSNIESRKLAQSQKYLDEISRNIQTDNFSLSSLLEIFKTPIRVEIPLTNTYCESSLPIPVLTEASISVEANPNSPMQELNLEALENIVCPLPICGKTFSTIPCINRHLETEHKSRLSVIQIIMEEMGKDPCLETQFESKAKKKKRFEEVCMNSSSSNEEEDDDNRRISPPVNKLTVFDENRVGKGVAYKCPICSKRMNFTFHFGQHVFAYHPDTELARRIAHANVASLRGVTPCKRRCPECQRIYKTASSLQIHMQRVHKVTTTAKQILDDTSFAVIDGGTVPKNDVKTEEECSPQEEELTPSGNESEEEIELSPPLLYMENPGAFRRGSGGNKLASEPKNFKPSFTNKDHPVFEECQVSKNKIYKCPICWLKVPRKDHFGCHVFANHPKTELARRISDAKVPSLHAMTPCKRKCPECNGIYKSAMSLWKHLKTVHNIKTTIRAVVDLKTCEVLIKDARIAKAVQEGKTAIRSENVSENSGLLNQPVGGAGLTSASFSNKTNCAKQAKFPCPNCGRNFGFEPNMKRHLKSNSCHYQPMGRKKKITSQKKLPMQEGNEMDSETELQSHAGGKVLKDFPHFGGMIDETEELMSITDHESAIPTSLHRPSIVSKKIRKYSSKADPEKTKKKKQKTGKAKQLSTTLSISEGTLSCQVCGLDEKKFFNFKKHVKWHVRKERKKIDKKQGKTCPICQEILEPERNLNLHIHWHKMNGDVSSDEEKRD